MNPLWLRILYQAATAAVVLAVLRRRRGEVPAFTVYLVTVWTLELVVFFWPERFFTRPFWIAQEIAYGTLRLLVVCDLAGRTLRRCRIGAVRWTTAAFLTLGATALLVAIATPVPVYQCRLHEREGVDCAMFEIFFMSTVPRLVNATIWAVTWLAVLAHGLALPLTRWERAIAIGFAFYLAVFSTALSAVAQLGLTSRTDADVLRTLAWVVLCGWWVRQALAPASAADAETLGLRARPVVEAVA